MPAMEGLARSLTVVEELAVARRVGEVQGAGPPVPEPLLVRPRARLREVAAGPPRQQALHRRRGLFRQKALQDRRVRSQVTNPASRTKQSRKSSA